MRILKETAGLALILLGIMLLATSYLLHISFFNIQLLLPLFFIFIGVIIHVLMQKHDSRY